MHLLADLVYLFEAPRGPFYSPKGPRSRWSFIWKLLAAVGGLLSECHLELAVGAKVHGAPNSPACGHRTVWCATGLSGAPRTDSPQATHIFILGLFLDLLNVFF
jgi:hypothetical protein